MGGKLQTARRWTSLPLRSNKQAEDGGSGKGREGTAGSIGGPWAFKRVTMYYLAKKMETKF